MKFRKKPIIIEAVQWVGQSMYDLDDFIDGDDSFGFTEDKKVIIETLEGTMTVQLNDWIIKGINGEFYPCKPDIFEKTYEPVDAK